MCRLRGGQQAGPWEVSACSPNACVSVPLSERTKTEPRREQPSSAQKSLHSHSVPGSALSALTCMNDLGGHQGGWERYSRLVRRSQKEYLVLGRWLQGRSLPGKPSTALKLCTMAEARRPCCPGAELRAVSNASSKLVCQVSSYATQRGVDGVTREGPLGTPSSQSVGTTYM